MQSLSSALTCLLPQWTIWPSPYPDAWLLFILGIHHVLTDVPTQSSPNRSETLKIIYDNLIHFGAGFEDLSLDSSLYRWLKVKRRVVGLLF